MMVKKRLAILMAATMLLLSAGCGKAPVEPTPSDPAPFGLAPDSLTMICMTENGPDIRTTSDEAVMSALEEALDALPKTPVEPPEKRPNGWKLSATLCREGVTTRVVLGEQLQIGEQDYSVDETAFDRLYGVMQQIPAA